MLKNLLPDFFKVTSLPILFQLSKSVKVIFSRCQLLATECILSLSCLSIHLSVTY